MDIPKGRVGAASQKASREEAEDEAKRRCAKDGLANCAIEVVYSNGCTALAWPVNGGRTAYLVADTLKEANVGAIKLCERNNGAACKIAYADCSKPVYEDFGF